MADEHRGHNWQCWHGTCVIPWGQGKWRHPHSGTMCDDPQPMKVK